MERNNNLTLDLLIHELITRLYQFNKLENNHFLKIPDYVALYMIMETSKENSIYEGRAYLNDLAEKMHLPIRQSSKMINALKEKGLVKWSHDGDGSRGTYIVLTEEGNTYFEQQKENLTDFYGGIIEKFGTENLIKMLNLMIQFQSVVKEEMEAKQNDTDS